MSKSATRPRSNEASQHDALSVLIGKWITEGVTIPKRGEPEAKILASDIYQWVPGKHFVAHYAYGRIGDKDVGGVEMIGYDKAKKQYQTHFFDSSGNLSIGKLEIRDDTLSWTELSTRCTGTLSDDGKTLTCRHEQSDDGKHWLPAMDVTLTKIE